MIVSSWEVRWRSTAPASVACNRCRVIARTRQKPPSVLKSPSCHGTALLCQYPPPMCQREGSDQPVPIPVRSRLRAIRNTGLGKDVAHMADDGVHTYAQL